MTELEHPTAAWIGLGYMLAGLVLMLEQLEVVTVSWSWLLPSLAILLGLALLLGAVRSRPSPHDSIT